MATSHDYPISDLAYLLPEMGEQSFSELVKSIHEVGLLEPISVWRGQILDGRHRYQACLLAGVEPEFQHLPDDIDPLAFVLAKGLDRRHLSTSQKAVIAYRLTVMSPEHVCSEDQACAFLHTGVTQQQAADRFRVSRRSLGHARAVLGPDSMAVPELRRAVEHGTVTVSDAAKIAGQPPDVQRTALDRVVNGAAKNVATAVRRIAAEAARSRSGIPGAGSVDGRLHTPVLHQCAVGDLAALVPAGTIDAIVTHPFLNEENLSLFTQLADFAVHALKDTGVLVVMADDLILPLVMNAMQHPHLNWVCEFNCEVHWPQNLRHHLHRITSYRRPILVYGKSRFRLAGVDVIRTPSTGEPDGETDQLKGIDAAMFQVVKHFIQAGQVMCDPCLLGRGGTAIGAMAMGCRFIGADPSKWAIEKTKDILAEAGYAGDHQHDALPE